MTVVWMSPPGKSNPPPVPAAQLTNFTSTSTGRFEGQNPCALMMHLSKPPSFSVASLTAKVGTAVEIDDDEQKFPFTSGLGTPDRSTSPPYAICAIQLSPTESRTKSQACLPS